MVSTSGRVVEARKHYRAGRRYWKRSGIHAHVWGDTRFVVFIQLVFLLSWLLGNGTVGLCPLRMQ